jgi:hypothetical protein
LPRRELVTRADLRRDLILNAATKPLNVAVTAVVAVAAVLLGALWLIAVAVTVYVALGALTFFDEREAERVGKRSYGALDRAAERVDPRKLAPPIAAQVEAARACEARINETIARGELPFAEVGGEVEALVSAIEQIAARAQRVYEYLATQDIGALEQRLVQLQTGGEHQSNQAIISALSEQREALIQLQEQLNRFYSQNEQLVASLGTINSQLVRMSVASGDEDQRDVVERVRELHGQVDAMSEGLREAYGKTDAPALPG